MHSQFYITPTPSDASITIFDHVFKALGQRKQILTVKAWLKLRREEKYYRDFVSNQANEVFGNLQGDKVFDSQLTREQKPTHGIAFVIVNGKLETKTVELE